MTMATQAKWDSIPDVEEQTPLPEPIKFDFRGNDRRRMKRMFRASVADGFMERAIGAPTLTRLKTRAVIKTEEELGAFQDELPYGNGDVRDEIQRQLREMYDVQNRVVNYDPEPENHPAYTGEAVDLEEGDVVQVCRYTHKSELMRDRGARVLEVSDPADATTDFIVRDVKPVAVLLESTHALNNDPEWWRREAIVGRNLRKQAELERRAEKKRRERERVQQRKDVDLDVLMEEIIIPHARKKANEVWPGGTVDVDDITWFWSNRYSWAAGYAYYGNAIPQDVEVEGKRLAIGLSPHYYYQHGIDALLGVVRHELIHIWQYEHPDSPNGGGHGRGFKQWLDDMDTHRHCNPYSK